MPLPRPCLMLVTEPMGRDRLVWVVREAVTGGVNALQLRDRTQSTDELIHTALLLKQHLGDTPILINGDPWAAREAGTHGVHLPEHGADVEATNLELWEGALIGRSVHGVEAAVRAERDGVDYLIAGTIFASRSHPDVEPAGLEFLRRVCAAVSLPVIAIGGVTAESCGACLTAGAAGVAVVSAILHAEDPRAAATRFWDRLSRLPGE